MKKDNEKLKKENKELKKDKESLIDNLSKKLLELEFKSDHSVKSKCLKWIVKKALPKYKKQFNTLLIFVIKNAYLL